MQDQLTTANERIKDTEAERKRLRDAIAGFFNCGQTGHVPQSVRDKMLDALNPTPPVAAQVMSSITHHQGLIDKAARDAENESEATT